MKAKTDPAYNEMAKLLKAMAHPSRLYILDLLQHRAHCVCELTELIGADISTVSKHLSVLKEARIVSDHKQGNKVFYLLKFPCVIDIYTCIRNKACEVKENQVVENTQKPPKDMDYVSAF